VGDVQDLNYSTWEYLLLRFEYEMSLTGSRVKDMVSELVALLRGD
jgi:hypothetical protein